MTRPNSRLRDLIREAIIQHFINTKRGIYYEELASLLGMNIPIVTPELDFLGDDDIKNGAPPMDALVVRKDTSIPAPEHFIHRANYFSGKSHREYYLNTLRQLTINFDVIPNEEWMKKVNRSLR